MDYKPGEKYIITIGEPVPMPKPDIVVYGECVGKKNNYNASVDRFGRAYIYKGKQLTDYERTFVEQCKKQYQGKPINTPFDLSVIVYYRNLKNDIDNGVTSILDGLQIAGIITDDKLCKRIVADKAHDPHRPRVELFLMPDPDPPSIFPEI